MNRRQAILTTLGGMLLPSCGVPGVQIPQVRKDGRTRIVFVHGIFQNGAISFGKLRRKLEDDGAVCFAPSLKPADARYGLDQLAIQLKKDIDAELGPKARFSLVGFSMGGLVSRYYLQELGGAARCDGLYTVSSPHHGTLTSHLYGGQGAKDMHPGSPFLQQLERSEGALGGMPVVSYRTPYDLVIVPQSSAIWDRAVNIEVPVLAHALMTKATPIVSDLEHRLAPKSKVSLAKTSVRS